MTHSVWLRVTARKSYRWSITKVELFKQKKPTCAASQIAMKLTLDIPDEAFEDSHIEFRATLPKPTKKVVEDADLASEVSDALSKRLGMKVKINVVEPSAPKRTFEDDLKEL